MSIDSSSYDIRLLELQSFRNIYVRLIHKEIALWNKTHIPWIEDTEGALEWLVKECASRLMQCRIHQHYQNDLGRYLFDLFPDILLDMQNPLSPLIEIQKRRSVRHMKIMVVGNILVAAMLY